MKKLTVLLLVLTAACGILHAQNNISEATARGFINRFPDPDCISWGGEANHFSWQAGYIMFAMEKMWRWTNDPRYFNYIKRYADQNVLKNGSVPNFSPTALDNFLPGYACLLMYEQTGEQKYARAAETIRRGFDSYPRMDEEMFLHSHSIKQVWVDGVFMGQIFMARYAATMGHPEDFQEVFRQIRGVEKLCGSPDGLLYHAWTGTEHTPEVWSEGMGWVAVLFADVLDYIPEDMDGRDEVLGYLQKMCAGLKAVQDPETGLWYQVVGKPGAEGNWQETSGSAMFTYLIQKSIFRGYIPADEYQEVVDKAYRGLLTRTRRNADGFINLLDCSSIGVQKDYNAYISQPKEISTFAAFASFMLATGLVEHSIAKALPEAFYATDYTQGKIFRFENGNIVWQHDAPLSNDLQVLENGNVLFTIGDGVLELDAEGNTVFEYKSDCHVFACQRLPDGRTFVGECENGRLLEISPKGKIVKRISLLPNGMDRADMSYMRNAVKLGNGHYLVAHYGLECVTEYDGNGRVVWSVPAPGRPHSVERLDNGDTMISIADANGNPRLVEVSAAGNIVWELSNTDLAGKPLRFVSGFQDLGKRGILITNWQGHRDSSTQPHLLWVTRDKRIRAVLEPVPGIETLSNVYLK